MKGVLTEYKVGENIYSSYIIGDKIEEIESKLSLRNLNESIISEIMHIETIIDYSKLKNEELIKRYSEFIHTICFLSYLCYKANKINCEELLNDEGILHEIIHINHKGSFTNKELEISRSLFVKLKRNTIGVF
ncbi:hypothetical protein [Myroides odoratimimus]|uniref:hypothetical protein n=1 Tax=Myroides odoratimimus TaxID=76832 RepID=UPI0025764A69|nr:hypothetical protein [Myroides odoratimimus]MDM1514697.1 hypothetical protein [Myroides odoratimimus]MDM1537530.1 hypothetical protein [Myroides odoratimimus]MDM1677123.1 hypothetical protein [Myroides odoratimimus]MDX4975114.1 hypothetical protein [Myroides odoratimimus]